MMKTWQIDGAHRHKSDKHDHKVENVMNRMISTLINNKQGNMMKTWQIDGAHCNKSDKHDHKVENVPAIPPKCFPPM